jgi:hypothetical protein
LYAALVLHLGNCDLQRKKERERDEREREIFEGSSNVDKWPSPNFELSSVSQGKNVFVDLPTKRAGEINS